MPRPEPFGKILAVTVKVGLSRLSVALHGAAGIVAIRTFPTPQRERPEEVVRLLEGLWPGRFPGEVPGALVSVVPDLTPVLLREWRRIFGRSLESFDGSRAPFPIDYRPAASLGADRTAAVCGACSRLGGQLGESFMVADFGTHTVTTVLCRGRLVGGAILPGISLMQGAIGAGRVLSGATSSGRLGAGWMKTRDLRRVSALGGGTREGVRAGTVLGTVAAVEGLRQRAEKESGTPLSLVLTGGLSPLLARFFFGAPEVSRQLLHHGARCFLLE